MEELKKKCKDLKIIVSAVDGIITDGLVPMDELQNILFKNYCVRDFEAINKIKKTFKFVFISQSNAINYNLFRARNIPFYFAQKNKEKTFVEIMRRYEIKPDNVMYIGCSYSDIACMHLAKVAFCTEDSPTTVNYAADYALPTSAGRGVISELYELLKHVIREKDLINEK